MSRNFCFLYPRVKKGYLYYRYIKVVRFLLDPPSFFEPSYMLLQNNCINNGEANDLKERKKACKQFYMVK